MKFKFILASAFLAGLSLSSMAQTHQEGVEYYKADQFDNAKELLLRNMNNAGTDKAISNYYLGLIALEEGKKNDALNYFNKGTQINPDYAFNYVGLGQIKLMDGDKKAAEDLFKEAKKKLNDKAQKAELDIAIARAYYNVNPQNYAKEIESNYNQAVKDSPKDKASGAVLEESIYIFDGDRFKDLRTMEGVGKAAGQYEMAIRFNPNSPEAYVKYANLYTDDSNVNPRYDLAINMLGELLKVNPQSALGQRERALAYYKANKFKEAAQEYEKYIKNPNHFKRDEDRYAFLLFYDQDYKGGYEYASKLLAENPDNFTARRFQFMNAAQPELQEMNPPLLQMATDLLAAHRANPSVNKFAPIDYILIGSELSNDGQIQEAEAVFKEAIADDPNNAEYYKQLALVYVEEKNLSKASDTYQEYIDHKENPGYNDHVQQATYAFYAGVENQQSNPDAAAKYYAMAQDNADKAKEIAPNYPKPYKIAGDIAKQTAPAAQVSSAAVPFYTQAIEIIESSEDPSRYKSDAKEIYNYLGNYYLDKNDKATALQYFNKYLTLDPNNDQYRKFVDGIK